ncbi:MAG TPA: magnesium transporter CorA family protein [bacterium]|nr:magnesium transporter CorA family protein [bacterium]
MKTKKQKLELINTLSSANFTWIHISKPSPKAIKYLERNFQFDPADLRDSAPPMQRSKLVTHSSYLFMILLFPYYDRETKTINPTEFDFFIGKDFLVTIEEGKIDTIGKLFFMLKNNQAMKKEYLDEDPIETLIETIHSLYNYCFPILNHFNLDTQEINKELFGKKGQKQSIQEILKVKNNIIAFNKLMRPHKNILDRLNKELPNYYKISDKETNIIQNTINYAKDIYEDAENYKENITALYDTHASLLAHNTNETMKRLTTISATLLPLSVIASVFGMNTVKGMPFMESESGFLMVIATMLFITSITLIYYKFKKWLD